ncbi:MAG: isoprenylcysteine carboxylmethyltransferase family protein [Nitrospira sp.]|nr:isoprenylcysteine carboxylmethyltransferase family protein [Nitrospira sp.]
MHRLELKIPPAIVAALIAAGMWCVSFTLPAFTYAPMLVATVGLGLIGFAIIGWAMLSFLEAQTTVNPMNPSSASVLVTSGVYRHTRNPMYLGIFLILVGWALFLANVLSFLVLPAFILYMNQFQIKPEERALKARFGREYLEYMAQAPRWI